jgi:hypothetical protein
LPAIRDFFVRVGIEEPVDLLDDRGIAQLHTISASANRTSVLRHQ